MTNKEKFLQFVSEKDSRTLEEVSARIRDRAMLHESQQIALKVLLKLDELGWSQKELAKKMGVSPQQISKVISGKENLTLETQIKLQTMLDIPILASYYEQKTSQIEEMILSFEERIDKIVEQVAFIDNVYQGDSATYLETFNYPLLIA